MNAAGEVVKELAGDTAKLAARLESVAGADAVILEPDELAYLSTDVYAAGELLPLALAPQDVDTLAAALPIISAAGYAIIPRGGGMSYTGGYTARDTRSVLIDLSRMNRILEVNAEDMTITVEPGVTWKHIYDELTPRGLRLPFFGTFSGARATVGGGLSNGALFMGTARYGTAAEIVLGLEVVCADGRRIVTGQAAFLNGKPFYRTYGPDLTGLFVHDAGSLGIKSRITLRMMEAPSVTGYASFVFDDIDSCANALSDIARADVAEEAYVFDPETTRASLSESGLASDVRMLAKVVGSSGSLGQGLKAGAKLVAAGRDFGAEDVFSLHVVLAGRAKEAVAADAERCRLIAAENEGREIPDSIPRAARAGLFGPLNGILGPDGRRWAALNAKVAHSDAKTIIRRTDEIIASYADRMQAADVTVSRLMIAISNHAFSFEPVLRWNDEWLPVHKRTPDPAYLKSLEEPPANPEARQLVARIRADIVAVFAEIGAASNQIGKTYPYFDALLPPTRELLLALKRELDPEGRMNPGTLGFPRTKP